MTKLSTKIDSGLKSIQRHFKGSIHTAVVLGSGLTELKLKNYELAVTLDYADIEGLPITTAPTHKGRLSIYSNGQKSIAVCSGRHHLYEGYSAQEVSTLIYLLRAMGATQLIVTNAAGALNEKFQPGHVMLIEDHINATGRNPVLGQDETLGTAFPDMSDAYNERLRGQCLESAANLGIEIQRGIYIGVLGPSLETSAERRMFRSWGADAIGMSTVTEVIAANHCGLQVLGLSAISNMALGDANQQPDTIEKVVANVGIAAEPIRRIIERMLQD